MIQAPVRFYRRLRGKRAFAQAERLARANRREAAAAAFDLAAAQNADDAGLRAAAIAAAAEIYETLGRSPEAADRLEQQLALGDNDLSVRRRLAGQLAALGRHATAAVQLQRLIAAEPQDGALWQALALARRALGDAGGELAAWRGAIAASPDKAAFHREAIRLLTAAGRLAEAAQARLRLAEIKADNAEAWRTAARALREAGEAEAAAEAWRRLLAVEAGDLEAHRALAAHHRQRDETAEAIPHLRVEAETAGGAKAAIKATARLALACDRIGDGEAAEAAWSRLLTLDPARRDAIGRLVALRRGRGDVAGAIAVLRSAAEAHPSVELQRDLAVLLAESGKPEQAVRAWARLVELAPDSRDAQLQLGLQLFDLGRRAEAADPLAEAAAGAPADLLLWRRLAWCRRGQEDLDGEAAAWRQVLQIAPTDDEAKARLIEVLIEADRRGEAEPLLTDLAARKPDDVRLLTHLARARRDLGDEAGALEAWRRVLAANPSEPDANQNIGEALLEAGDLAAAADHLAAAARPPPSRRPPGRGWLRSAATCATIPARSSPCAPCPARPPPSISNRISGWSPC